MSLANFEEDFNHSQLEQEALDLWSRENIYAYDANSDAETFSVDTPPPYVSAAHLHVGHAMSYSQAEFLVRYQRMLGKNIYYPMGFDDNGLPTERYVEQKYKINKKKITRPEFRELCIKETQEGGAIYEELWKSLGLSVDWNFKYSTINTHCRHTAQKSFVDLYKKGRIYRSDEPVIWDTHFDTSLSQADVETLSRRGKMFDIAFKDKQGNDLVISTTRPELLGACVALYVNPQDERYADLVASGENAVVPLFGYEVPIKTSEEVKVDFGTGLMMCCTFGDAEDVAKWKKDKLDLRIIIGRDGKLLPLAGKYEGLAVDQARAAVVKDLKEEGFLLETHVVEQNVSVAERSGQPIEFVMEPQWFIRVMDMKEELLQRCDEIEWYPEFMKVRLQHWIEGLKYDWNISRQRFYGVPFPIWYDEDGNVVVAKDSELPIDPSEQQPAGYEGQNLRPELDVMDTWMTSSLSPQINANWAGGETWGIENMDDIFPMGVRVQAFEIIRTWLFYTVVKSHLHHDSLPWKRVMISGWGLNEQGKKISKRDLEKYTDKDGYNRYEPAALIEKYSADALRYWAAGSHLGQDLKFQEKSVKAGRRIVIKLWNVARLTQMLIGEASEEVKNTQVEFSQLTPLDQWLLTRLHQTTEQVTLGFDKFDYAVGREALEKFFWSTYCDDYLELVKERFWKAEQYSDAERASAVTALQQSLRTLLGLYAPYMPFITEAIYQRCFKEAEGTSSLHITSFPQVDTAIAQQPIAQSVKVMLAALGGVRQLRSANKISAGKVLPQVWINSEERPLDPSMLNAAARCETLSINTEVHTVVDISETIQVYLPEDKEQKQAIEVTLALPVE